MEYNKITKADIVNGINTVRKNPNGTVYQKIATTAKSDVLYLVFGLEIEGGQEYPIAKLAFNTDDLQCDYDWDWIMPTITGLSDVYDTESRLDSADDIDWAVEYYNKEAEQIIRLMNKGELKY